MGATVKVARSIPAKPLSAKTAPVLLMKAPGVSSWLAISLLNMSCALNAVDGIELRLSISILHPSASSIQW